MEGLASVGVVLAIAGAGAPGQPRVAGCPVFPAGNPWSTQVDSLPVAANSKAIIASIGSATGLHPDFGSALSAGKPIGIPYTIVAGKQAKVRVSFDYADESDRGPYPIPGNVKIEGGGDRHALIVERSSCRLYELFTLRPTRSGWHAGSGAIWNLRSNRLRPAGWTSADAGGLPILPGLARYDEVAAGRIDHALRFTVERSRRAYVYPARHYASDLTGPNLPPMGLRLRLRGSFDTRPFPRQARVVLEALKHYGMVVADNGSNWFVSGAPDSRWNDDDLHTLGQVKGSDFEVVEPSAIHP